MKLLASLLIVVSLTLGLIATVTAYAPAVDSLTADDLPLTLTTDIGKQTEADDAPPLYESGTEVTEEILADLQAKSDDIPYIRVREFAFHRWGMRWWLIASAAGLLVGSLLLRFAAKAETLQPTAVTAEPAGSPPDLLKGALDRVRALRAEVGQTTPGQTTEVLHRIGDELDAVRRENLEPFVIARNKLIAQYGMGGFAQIMDRFAASERQLNRAWSAAADHVLHESLDSLAQGEVLLEETIRRLESMS